MVAGRRGNNNIAESIFAQMRREPHSAPTWIVCGAGTGGTSATMGRYVRYFRHPTQICVADPEASVFHRHWHERTVRQAPEGASLIEGIGRPTVESSLVPTVIDRMEVVEDQASIAAARVISRHLGRAVGGSAGTNLVACARLAMNMVANGQNGSIVSILCDSGERYASTIFDDRWLEAKGLNIRSGEERFERLVTLGIFED